MAVVRKVLVTRVSPKGAYVEVCLMGDFTLRLAVNGSTPYAGLTIAFPEGVTESNPIVEDLLRLTAAHVLRAEGR